VVAPALHLRSDILLQWFGLLRWSFLDWLGSGFDEGGLLRFLRLLLLCWRRWREYLFRFCEEVELAVAGYASVSGKGKPDGKPVSPSSLRVSMVESRTSSAVRCSFSFSPARSSARSSAKVYGSRLTMARSKTRNCADVNTAGAFAMMRSNVASRLFRNSSRRTCSTSCSACSRSNCCLR
jgi:hypothetical protein